MRAARAVAARVAAATPRDRDRYLDALRVVAVLFVVSGHWLVRVVVDVGNGAAGAYLLNLRPQLQWATLIWQVMPVFFFVGAVVNLRSWRRARAAGEAPARWIRRRAQALLVPALVLLGALVPLAAFFETTSHAEEMVFDFGVAVFPVWFLAVYIAVTALVPATAELHERGRGHWLLLGGAAIAVALDLLRFAGVGPVMGTQPVIAAPNFLIIWVVVHQVGYHWADGVLDGRGPALALGGAGALAAMTVLGPWPLAMVPFEGTGRPNNGAPPSAALLALASVQLGLAVALRRRAQRWLARPGIWAVFALIGGQIIAVYLWHQPAMLAVANLAGAIGWHSGAGALDAGWWGDRGLWVLACAAVLAPLLALAAGLARLWRPAPGADGGVVTGLGILLASGGLAGLIGTRLVQPEMPLSLPVGPLLALLAGAAMLGLFNRRGGRAG